MSFLDWFRKKETRAVQSFGSLNGNNVWTAGGEELLGVGSDVPEVRRVAGYPPVSQALQMIAGDCSKIPCRVYQKYYKNDVEERYLRPNHYAANLIDLYGSPNDVDTTFDLFFDWFFDALLFGGGYLWVHRDGPMPVSIHKLLPDRTWPVFYKGKRFFRTELGWSEGESNVEFLPNDDVLFLQGVNLSPWGPANPIKLYREIFNQAINATDYTTNYFKQGTQAGGILMAPPGAGETSIKNAEKAIEERRNKSNWFKTLVLKDGYRWQSVTGSLKDADTVPLDEATARHVCRIFNLPPSKLGLSDTVSYNSLEQENRQYIDSCLSTWLVQARSQFHKKLVIPSDQASFIVDYEIDYLNWADSQAKATVLTQLIDRGVMSPAYVATKYYSLPTTAQGTTPNQPAITQPKRKASR